MDRRYDYNVDARRAATFYPAIRNYWPALPDGSLVPDYAGIRPKLSGPGEPAVDFIVDGPEEHGLPGLVHLSASSCRDSRLRYRWRKTWWQASSPDRPDADNTWKCLDTAPVPA